MSLLRIGLLVAALVVLLGAEPAGAVVTRYTTSTARNAGGVACTQQQRCTNAYALSQSAAGDTVSMEGNTMASPYEYKGVNDMLKPPVGVSGNSLDRITVLCEVDGGCLINAEFATSPIDRHPVHLSSANQYWHFTGFNAQNAGQNGVIRIEGGSHNNRFTRIVVWDSPIDTNSKVIQLIASSNNEFIDVAAFGTGRKVFEPYQGSNNTVCRRCWFRWEGSTNQATGDTGSPYYLSTGTVFENVLATWSGEMLPHTYTSVVQGITYTDHKFGDSRVMAGDRINSATTPKPASVTIRGSIIYTKSTDNVGPVQTGSVAGGPMPGLGLFGASSITLSDVVRVMSPSHTRFNNHMGFVLTRRPQNCVLADTDGVCEDPVTNNTATRLTSIRGNGRCYGIKCGDSFGTAGVSGFANETDWAVSNTSVGTSLGVVLSPWRSGTPSGNGAHVCHPINNGVVDTSTGLWPWPMDDRIREATRQAGAYTGPCSVNCKNANGTPYTFPARQITNVTQEIEALLGPIPAACRSDTAPPPFSDATGYAPGTLSAF